MADFLKLRDTRVRVSVAMAALGVATSFGCGQSAKPRAAEGVVPKYNAESGRLERISYDRNKDSKPDAWLFMDGARVTRAELDENADGSVDRWEYYRPDAPSDAPRSPGDARRELEKAEQATRFDGKVSRWEIYEQGRLVKAEEDTTGDGRPDKWETWKDGSLAEVALDTKGTGKADRRILFSADGSSQMLVDAGDGTFRPLATKP
jgi:hypothetical protein